MTVIRNADGNYEGLACDTCAAPAPDTATIMAGHGLINLGWYCSGGTHICPNCPHPAVDRPRSVPLAGTTVA